MTDNFLPDADTFREMDQPYSSFDAAQEALTGFQKDMEEIRKKWKIPTILYVILLTVKTETGEGAAMLTGGFGNQLLFESLAAFALGQEQADRQERVGELMAKGLRKGKKKG